MQAFSKAEIRKECKGGHRTPTSNTVRIFNSKMFKFHHSQPTDQRTRCWETGPKKSVALEQFFRKIAQELLLQANIADRTNHYGHRISQNAHQVRVALSLSQTCVLYSIHCSRDWLILLSAVTILQHTVPVEPRTYEIVGSEKKPWVLHQNPGFWKSMIFWKISKSWKIMIRHKCWC